MFYGEYLVNAQGEDVVAGIRTPQPLSQRRAPSRARCRMEEALPDAYAELLQVREKLETALPRHAGHRVHGAAEQAVHAADPQRQAHRRGGAAHRGGDGARGADRRATRRCGASTRPRSTSCCTRRSIRRRRARCSPRACRPAPARRAARWCSAPTRRRAARPKGEAVILVRIETSPEDIHGMHAARGILTTRGGMTSHAAVVARGMGRPCVAGAGGDQRRLRRADACRRRQDGAGRRDHHPRRRHRRGVRRLACAMIEPALSGDFGTLMEWADAAPPHERARQRRNAAGRRDRAQIRRRGHRPVPHRAHVLRPRAHRRGAADDHGAATSRPPRGAGEAAAVPARGFPQAVPHHGRAAGDDPPARSAAARIPAACATPSWRRWPTALGTDVEAMRRRVAELAEANPMLGHRGCRLGITYPEIYEMQARAIFEGAIAVAKETGNAPVPEIMIPLVGMQTRAGDHPRPGRRAWRRRCSTRRGTHDRIQRRHHDRAAARRADRRRDRRRSPISSASAPTT